MSDVPEKDRPISEQFRLVARAYADAEAAATLLEELKTTTLEKLKSKVIVQSGGDMPDNRAERLAKCGNDWEQYLRQMCDARAKANKLKLQLAYIKMRHAEWTAANADARSERRLGNASP